MPRRELSRPQQIADWLNEWGAILAEPAEMILIGSGALLWHAHKIGVETPLPENSMDVDPVTSSEAVAELAYDSIIGSDFERKHGWHVNLMPDMVLRDLPEGWKKRCDSETYGNLTVVVPSVSDLLWPKMKRNEPRDYAHKEWAISQGILRDHE
jgi:hypothetical protein